MTTWIAFDTETECFRPGRMAPKIVCLQWQSEVAGPVVVHAQLEGCEQLVRAWLKDPRVGLVGHALDYDMAVLAANWPHLLPYIFDKYEAGLAVCTQVRQSLLDIAAGSYRGVLVKEPGREKARFITYTYSLEALAKRICGMQLSKPKGSVDPVTGQKLLDPDHVRLRYGEMMNIAVAEWPKEFVDYALDDARATLAVWLAQEPHAQYMKDQFRQSYNAFCLRLEANWGLLTDKEGVEILERASHDKIEEAKEVLIPCGIVRADGTRNMKEAQAAMARACAAQNIPVPLTDKGNVELSKEACSVVEDPVIQAYAVYSSENYVLSNEIPTLREGLGRPIHCRYSILKSGRWGASQPPVQNRSKRPGAREAFVPSPGKVFITADYNGLELHSMAQMCLDLFGHSELAKVLNTGQDAHTAFAASMYGCTYDEGIAFKNASDKRFEQFRGYAKVAHFGIPGGLGTDALVDYAWSNYRIKLGETRNAAKLAASDLKNKYFSRYPEVSELFRYVKSLVLQNGFFTMPRSERILRAEFFTRTCNNTFQGSGADAATCGMRLLVRRCYSEASTWLFKSHTRPVVWVHDENVCETDDNPDTLTEALDELEATMREGADIMLPDVPTRVEGAAMRYWSKKAKRVEVGGRVVPWTPKKVASE